MTRPFDAHSSAQNSYIFSYSIPRVGAGRKELHVNDVGSSPFLNTHRKRENRQRPAEVV